MTALIFRILISILRQIFFMQAVLKSITPLLENKRDSGHLFAKEIQKYTLEYFKFILDSKNKDFLPVYWAASFLSPEHSHLLSPEEQSVAIDYLKRR